MIENTPSAWSRRAVTEAMSWDAALWSQEGQQERFDAVLAALGPHPGDTLLDFGCGTGALIDSLPATVTYVGYDWSAGMLDRAKREHPHGEFLRDRPSPRRLFDLVACVGPFNLADMWSKRLTWLEITRLWREHVPRALVASLYAGDDTECLSYERREVAEFVAGLDAGASSIGLYRSNDLLLTVRR